MKDEEIIDGAVFRVMTYIEKATPYRFPISHPASSLAAQTIRDGIKKALTLLDKV